MCVGVKSLAETQNKFRKKEKNSEIEEDEEHTVVIYNQMA